MSIAGYPMGRALVTRLLIVSLSVFWGKNNDYIAATKLI